MAATDWQTSYSELAEDVRLYLFSDNSTLNSETPRIIRNGQKLCMMRLDREAFRVTGAPQTVLEPANRADPHIEIPEAEVAFEIRSIIGLFPDEDRELDARQLEYCNALYGFNAQGWPVAYSYLEQRKIRLFPRPVVTPFQVMIQTNQPPPLLNDSTVTTNVLTDEYPRLIQAAVLVEGAKFMRDNPMIELYQGQFDQALTEANAQVARRRRDESDQRPIETVNATGA